MDDVLQAWIDEAAVLCRALAADGFRSRKAAAKAAAVTWRWAESESGVHRPEPFAAERRGSRGGWIDEPTKYGSADRVGFDDAGRPAIVVSWFGGREGAVVETWEHSAERSVGLWRLDDTVGAEPRASVTILDDLARPTVVVSAKQGTSWLDGVPQVELALERWTWDGDRPTRGELRPSSASGGWQASGSSFITLSIGDDDEEILEGAPAVVEPTYDAAGTLVGLSVDDRPLIGEAAKAWAEARWAAAPRHTIDEDDDSGLPAAASTDRAALSDHLLACGVTDAEAIVRDHAVVALRLEPRDESEDGTLPGTRLYGRRGLLPPGGSWPRATNGRALAFLAALDLAELPREILDTPNPLPAAGWLLFYADLDTASDDGRDWEQGTFLGEGYANAPGEPSRVLWVPPGEDPVDAEPPPRRATAAAPTERRCAIVPQLQLPTSWDTYRAIGVPEDQEEGYSTVAYGLSPAGLDFVLGNASGVQGHGLEPGEAVLLHLGVGGVPGRRQRPVPRPRERARRGRLEPRQGVPRVALTLPTAHAPGSDRG